MEDYLIINLLLNEEDRRKKYVILQFKYDSLGKIDKKKCQPRNNSEKSKIS